MRDTPSHASPAARRPATVDRRARARVGLVARATWVCWLAGCAVAQTGDPPDAAPTIAAGDAASDTTGQMDRENPPDAPRDQASAHDGAAIPLVSVRPPPYDKAFANPLKGFRPDLGTQHTYGTLVRHYIPWNAIENSAADGVEKIKAYCNAAWKDLPASNTKIIPRVFLEWPGRGTHWPADLTTGDYTSPAFRARLVALIKKLGEAWNPDPRVAFVQSGLIGQWGEQHRPSPPADLQALMGDAFVAAFPDKPVENRYPYHFTSHGFGIYWDAFGCDENDGMRQLGDRWHRVPYEGEIAYNYCRPAGQTPTEDVSAPQHLDTIHDLIRTFHTTALGWISAAPYNSATAAGIDQLQKAFGYHFVIEQARFSPRVEPGGAMDVELRVRNDGSAPFYFRWPIEVALLSPRDRAVVWKTTSDAIDIRAWLPGDDWNAATNAYVKTAVARTSSLRAQIPPTVAAGEYVLAIAVVDPAGGLPSLRFANANYFRGGHHPLGRVGVGVTPASIEVAGPFDELASDRLRYLNVAAP